MTTKNQLRYVETAEDLEELDVGEDPSLLPMEKQFSLTTTKDDQEFTVHSEVASITRWLLRHPAFELTRARVIDGEVCAVTGRLPIGTVDLKGRPRNTDQFARMLSTATLRDRDADT